MMADEAAAPADAGAPPAGGPPVRVTDFNSAVEAVQGLLESEPGSPEKTTPAPPTVTLEGDEAPAEESPEKTPKADEAEGEEPSADENAEAEPPAESDELPETFQGLAEHLGVEAAELAAHLQVQIKNPDGTVKETITFAEAIRGHLRESDYHAKTEAVAQERKTIEAMRVQATQALQARFQHIDGLIGELQGQLGEDFSPEKMAQLLNDDPTAYLHKLAQKEAKQLALQKAAETRNQEHQRAQHEQGQRAAQHLQSQRQMLTEKIPALRDPKKAAEWLTGIGEYLTNGAGFSHDEVAAYANSTWDHRYWVLADKARKFDALQKGQAGMKAAIKGKPPVIKPGAAKGKPTGDETRNQLRSRLRRTGSFDDAVQLVKGIL